MKVFKFTKKKIITITAICSCLVLVFICTKSFGMQHYYNELSWPFIAVSIAGDW